MKPIVKIKFGSHLYGTETPNSDLDYKSVFIPEKKDILLQRAPKSIQISNRVKKEGEKNIPGEYEEEAYSLHYYIKLLLEGQTVALDMLFAPNPLYLASSIEISGIWAELLRSKKNFISKKSAAFVGYCKQQANKYGIKGSSVSTVRKVLDTINTLGDLETLYEIDWVFFRIMNSDIEHYDLEYKTQPNGKTLPFLNVCGKSFPLTVQSKLAKKCLQKMMDNYGQRAILAERNEAVDWKALSHAVRVANQAIELFKSGNIIFPLVNAKHILDIKIGKLAYKEVAEEIERLLEEVNKESAVSALPDHPDYEFADDFVSYWYGLECSL